MSLKVLAIIIASSSNKVNYAVAPSRTYTVHEYEQKHGFNSICRSQVKVDTYHIIPGTTASLMNQELSNLSAYLGKHSFDTVHFYFEQPRLIQINKTYWQSMFSLAFAIVNINGLQPYFFTDSNYNIPLRSVVDGVFHNISSVGYSDYLDSLY